MAPPIQKLFALLIPLALTTHQCLAQCTAGSSQYAVVTGRNIPYSSADAQYEDTPVPAADACACASICEGRGSNCHFATFESGQCTTKRTKPRDGQWIHVFRGAGSALQIVGDIPGFDNRDYFKVEGRSVEGCHDLCMSIPDDQCTWFNYLQVNRWCYVKIAQSDVGVSLLYRVSPSNAPAPPASASPPGPSNPSASNGPAAANPGTQISSPSSGLSTSTSSGSSEPSNGAANSATNVTFVSSVGQVSRNGNNNNNNTAAKDSNNQSSSDSSDSSPWRIAAIIVVTVTLLSLLGIAVFFLTKRWLKQRSRGRRRSVDRHMVRIRDLTGKLGSTDQMFTYDRHHIHNASFGIPASPYSTM